MRSDLEAALKGWSYGHSWVRGHMGTHAQSLSIWTASSFSHYYHNLNSTWSKSPVVSTSDDTPTVSDFPNVLEPPWLPCQSLLHMTEVLVVLTCNNLLCKLSDKCLSLDLIQTLCYYYYCQAVLSSFLWQNCLVEVWLLEWCFQFLKQRRYLAQDAFIFNIQYPTCQILDSPVRYRTVWHVQTDQLCQVSADGEGQVVCGNVGNVQAGQTTQTWQTAAQCSGQISTAGDLSILRQAIPQSFAENIVG